MSAEPKQKEAKEAKGRGRGRVPVCEKCYLAEDRMEWHPADDRQCCPKCGTPLWWKAAAVADKVVPMAGAFGSQVGGDHYRTLAIQPAEYAQRNGLGFIEGCVVKYVTRHRRKDGANDIRKAMHFLQMLLEVEYPEAAEPDAARDSGQKRPEPARSGQAAAGSG